MKFQIQKTDLMGLIGKAQNIVEKRTSMPILINILMSAESGKLKIFATDLEVSLTDEVEIKQEEPGRVAIDAKNLYNLVKELNEGLIWFHKKENNWVEIRQNKSVFNIVGISAEEYPVFPTDSTAEFTTVKAKTFLEMIEKTIYSVSTDETRYHLNGVFFEVLEKNGGEYRMVATDGHRLCLVDREAKGTEISKVKSGVIIPRKGLNEIKKILEANKDADIEFVIEGSQLIVKLNATMFMIRLIEGKYPAYQALIPQTLKRHLNVPREQLLASLRRVSLLSNQKSKGVTFSVTNNQLQITSQNPELGDAKEELEVDYKSPDEIKIGFNARYLLEAIQAFEDDTVSMDFNDQVSPVVIRPGKDKNYTCIVMPMRI
jgi:DNA polymerase III subunit beta